MHYFLFFGLIELLILSWKDIRELKIDSRYNWFMYGVSASMIATEKPKVIYLVALMLSVVIIGMFLSRYMPYGDVECLGWCLFGMGMLHWIWLVLFLTYLFLSVSFVVFVLRRFLKVKEKVEYPGVPVFLSAFVMTVSVILKYTA